MTDRPPPDLDESASATVDGEASTEDARALGSDALSTTRVETFRNLQEAHRSLGLLEASTSTGTDERIATALAQLQPAPLQIAPARRSRPPRAVLVVGVAAAIALVVLGAVVIRPSRDTPTAAGGGSAVSEQSTDSQEKAATPPTTSLPNRDEAQDQDLSGAAQAHAPSAVGAGADRLPFLGDFADLGQLIASARTAGSTLGALDAASGLCPGVILPTRGSAAARATVGGADVVVVVSSDAVTVVEPSTCRVLTP